MIDKMQPDVLWLLIVYDCRDSRLFRVVIDPILNFGEEAIYGQELGEFQFDF